MQYFRVDKFEYSKKIPISMCLKGVELKNTLDFFSDYAKIIADLKLIVLSKLSLAEYLHVFKIALKNVDINLPIILIVIFQYLALKLPLK